MPSSARLKQPLVTIAILTYNRPHYLREALSAALQQTYPNLEILICDNASDLATFEVIREFEDDRIVHLRQSVNKGVVGNYYEAARRATGEYALITHDDDIMEATLVERQIRVLEENPECVAVASNVSTIDKDGLCVQERLLPIQAPLCFPKGDYVKEWVRTQLTLPITTVMCRRKLKGRSVGVVNPNVKPLEIGVYGDIYGMCRLNLFGDIVLLDEPLLRYRQHGQQDSFSDDLIDSGVLFHEHLARLCRRRAPELVPLIKGRRLHYLTLSYLSMFPDSLAKPLHLKAKVSDLDQEWQAKCASLDEKTPTSLLFEILKHYLGISTLPKQNLRTVPENEFPESYLESWLALRVADDFSICDAMGIEPGAKVAILGSVFNAFNLALDCVQSGRQVVTFLDSNVGRQGKTMGGFPIAPPAWLASHGHEIDVVLISSERDRAQGIRAFLQQHLPENWKGDICYWRDGIRHMTKVSMRTLQADAA